jgi:hypothetical protein
MQAQYTLRGDTAHFQYGVEGNYKKYDVPATTELRMYYNQQREDGETVNSLAGSDTQYALVHPVLSKVEAFEFVIAKTVGVDV